MGGLIRITGGLITYQAAMRPPALPCHAETVGSKILHLSAWAVVEMSAAAIWAEAGGGRYLVTAEGRGCSAPKRNLQ